MCEWWVSMRLSYQKVSPDVQTLEFAINEDLPDGS